MGVEPHQLQDGAPTAPLPTHLRSAVITCSGFLQKQGEESGPAKIDRAVKRLLRDRCLDHVALRTWNSDHSGTAAEILRLGCDKIVLIGYSYGCGWGIKRLCRELDRQQRHLRPEHRQIVDLAILIDPVPRSWFVFANVAAMTRVGKYRVPGNVMDVVLFRQVEGPPFGRNVKTARRTQLLEGWHFGTPGKLARHAPKPGPVHTHVEPEEGQVFNHLTIDDVGGVRDRILNLLKARIVHA